MVTDQEYRKELLALSASGDGIITKHDANSHGYAYVDLSVVNLDPEVVSLLSCETAHNLMAMPVIKDGTTLWVCMQMPPRPQALERLALETKCRVIPVAVIPKALQLAVSFHYPADPEQA